MTAPTRLEIDLGALAANWRMLAARAPGRTAAVVKADGYGLGAAQVGAALARAGCGDFFVATLDEAVALRAVLPDADIAVLNGLASAPADAFLDHRLLPVLNTLGEIAAWGACAARHGHAVPAFLHVDTGMNRLGLSAAEVATLRAAPERLAGVSIACLMTHLAAAEWPDDPSNAAQLARFADARAALPAAPTSIANSSGMFLDGAGSDLARPGAALYGLNPRPDRPNPMRPVVRLMAQVIALRDVPAGALVGYNGSWAAARPSRIATVAVGYADGFPRSLSNRSAARFDGRAVPLVGRVSMDLTTYDVTDHPGLVLGDWLELIGPHCPPDALAAAAGTIGYEILTSLGARYPRTYSETAAPEHTA